MSRRAKPAARRQRRESSAGGIVTRLDGDHRVYLLIRDKHGNWGFPKGHIEGGEAPEAAALREVGEETGVSELRVCAAIPPIQWMFTWQGTLVRKTCQFFLMETAVARTTPQTDEGITECRWAPLSEALGLLRYENARQVLRAADSVATHASDTRPAVS